MVYDTYQKRVGGRPYIYMAQKLRKSIAYIAVVWVLRMGGSNK